MPGGSPPSGGMPGNTREPGVVAGGSSNSASQANSTMSPLRGGLQFGPPGRWWDDKHFAKNLHLRPEQQKRMDSHFDENRANLVSRYQALQQEEARMDEITRAQTLDEKAIFAQIDRLTAALADLEKAKTHLMLQLRNEMDADQITRLQATH
jgi:Spy/CpxP family protein refolding chaperone